MQFTSISADRRTHRDAGQELGTNPVLDAIRDLSDDDPWGDSMILLGTLSDLLGADLRDGEQIEITEDDSVAWYLLGAIGFGMGSRGGDGPYDWPTLVETTHYDPEVRQEWLRHAFAVMDHREGFTRSLGLSY